MTDTTKAQPIYFPFDDRDEYRDDEDSEETSERIDFDSDGNALPNKDRPTPITG